MRQKSIKMWRTAGLTVALTLTAIPAKAETYDFSVFHSDKDAWVETLDWWAKEVAKKTEGRVKFNIVYGGALTSAPETLNAVRDNIVPSGLAVASFGSGSIPALSYLEPMFWLPSDADKATRVMSALEQPLQEQFNENGLHYLWMQPSFGLLVACRDKHLATPSDWEGTKVRAAGRWQGIQVESLGASPVAIGTGEQYLALQNGTVDCALSNATLAHSLRLHEVGPKITYLAGAVNASIYLMNAEVWDSLSEEDQKTLTAVSREALRRGVTAISNAYEGALSQMESEGADVMRLSEDQLTTIREHMSAVDDVLPKAAGEGGKGIAAVLEKESQK